MPDDQKRPLHIAAKALGLEKHVLEGVKAWRRWDDLYEVTDDELRAAVTDVTTYRIS